MAVANSIRTLLRTSVSVRHSCRFSSIAFQSIVLKPTLKTTQSCHLFEHKFIKPTSCVLVKFYSRPSDKEDNDVPQPSQEKLSLFQRFKQMYRDYWYVLVPVHLVTSAFWFGGFYYMAKSGIDIVAILESWNVSEKITNPLKDSSMGYIAVSYALYKIFTPLRYTVTLGGTTLSIKYLKEWGYIRPVPSTQQLKDMYEMKRHNILESMKETQTIYKEKRDNIKQQMKDTKDELLLKKEELKTKKEDIMGNFENTLKNIHEETSKKIKPAQSPAPVVRNIKEKKH